MAEGMAIPGLDPETEVRRGPLDVTLLLVVGALVTLGMLAVYNGSALSGADETHFFKRQVQGVLLGTGAMIFASRLDYRIYRRQIRWITLFAFVLLAATVFGAGTHAVKGATRWLNLGFFSIQPAEVAKLVTVMYVAYSIEKKGLAMKKLVESFLAHGIVFVPMVVLLMMQPDFGSSIIICTMVTIMVWVGGARTPMFMGLLALGGVFVWGAVGSERYGYRIARIEAWLDPWAHYDGAGRHVVNSFVALGRGGWDGTGMGEGVSRLGYIPELHNDFVAASVGEEFGFVGLATLAVFYLVLVWRGLAISQRARESFGSFLAFGITVLLGMQAAINLCVVTGVLPTKGLTLPFVSYGRSSMIVCLFAIGILLNIGQRNPGPARGAPGGEAKGGGRRGSAPAARGRARAPRPREEAKGERQCLTAGPS